MSSAPIVDISLNDFWADPYPKLAALRAETPIVFVPQLNATLFTRHADISASEKNIDVFSSQQPNGLMNKVMGHNLMRKDGAPHKVERKAILPSISPQAVKAHWYDVFSGLANELLDDLMPKKKAELVADFALPYAGECLKAMTGLIENSYADIDRWSQAMIDAISNYEGNPDIEEMGHTAVREIHEAIDERVTDLDPETDLSLLGVMLNAGLPMDSIYANICLAISGGQNEPRDALAGAIWALLTHPDQLETVKKGEAEWLNVFEEYCRWIAPVGMSPRRIAQDWKMGDIDLKPEDAVFFMFSSANRDETVFGNPDRFDVSRDTSRAISFGAGPHFCAGAWASRTMIGEIALPRFIHRAEELTLDDNQDVEFGGWAFRGPLKLSAAWI